MTKNLTEGKPMRLILEFCVPVFLAMLFQQFYNLVDTMIVGKTLGAQALAAVGSTSSLSFMVIGFCSGVCAGFAIPMAQAFGANNEKELKRFIGNAWWLCLIISVVMAVACGLLCKPMLRLMNTPEDILEDAFRYIDIIFWGIPATYLYNILSCMIRAVGDSKTPVIFLGLAALLNVVLDVALITVVHMGVAGASVATVASQAISGIMCLVYLKKKFPILQPSGDEWQFRKRYAWKLFYVGGPMGLQYSITAIGSLILQTAVNSLGTVVVATVTAADKLNMIFGCMYEALGSTIATYSGQNVGAGKYSRVREGVRSCMMIAAVYAVFAIITYRVAGSALLTLFLDAGETEMIANARRQLMTYSMFYICLAIVNIFRFCIQGMGYSQIAMCAGGLEMLARAAVGLFLIPAIGFTGACFGHPCAWVAADAFLIPAYYHYACKPAKAERA